MTIFFKGSVLLTAPVTQADMEFVATIQHLAKTFAERGYYP